MKHTEGPRQKKACGGALLCRVSSEKVVTRQGDAACRKAGFSSCLGEAIPWRGHPDLKHSHRSATLFSLSVAPPPLFAYLCVFLGSICLSPRTPRRGSRSHHPQSQPVPGTGKVLRQRSLLHWFSLFIVLHGPGCGLAGPSLSSRWGSSDAVTCPGACFTWRGVPRRPGEPPAAVPGLIWAGCMAAAPHH